jgi:hypothetical protein
MKQTKTILNEYLINFGHLFFKVIMKLILKVKIIIKIPIKLSKKFKTSSLPQEIEMSVKYNEITIPNVLKIIFPQNSFIFSGDANFIIIFYIIIYKTHSTLSCRASAFIFSVSKSP